MPLEVLKSRLYRCLPILLVILMVTQCADLFNQPEELPELPTERLQSVLDEYLLTHRSGLFNYVRSLPLLENIYHNPSRHRTVNEVLRIVRDEGSPDFPPGEGFRYSNTNYVLLGVAIEHVTGKSYQQALNERIIKKLNLNHTFMPDEPLLGRYEDVAHGYEDAAYGFAGRAVDAQEFNLASGTAWAAGGLVSNTTDLTRFLRALVSGKLFQRETAYQMMSEPGPNEWYAMGLFVFEHPTLGWYVGHAGAYIGFNAYAYYFPDHDLAISGCINLDGSVEFIESRDLMDLLAAELPGI
jgi:D-alanyl-D-alanine carboxypeptidase